MVSTANRTLKEIQSSQRGRNQECEGRRKRKVCMKKETTALLMKKKRGGDSQAFIYLSKYKKQMHSN